MKIVTTLFRPHFNLICVHAQGFKMSSGLKVDCWKFGRHYYYCSRASTQYSLLYCDILYHDILYRRVRVRFLQGGECWPLSIAVSDLWVWNIAGLKSCQLMHLCETHIPYLHVKFLYIHTRWTKGVGQTCAQNMVAIQKLDNRSYHDKQSFRLDWSPSKNQRGRR